MIFGRIQEPLDLFTENLRGCRPLEVTPKKNLMADFYERAILSESARWIAVLRLFCLGSERDF